MTTELNLFDALEDAVALESGLARPKINRWGHIPNATLRAGYDQWERERFGDVAAFSKAHKSFALILRRWAGTVEARPTLAGFAKAAHAMARSKGWWDGYDLTQKFGQTKLTPDQILSQLMLITTEVAEAAEDVRIGVGVTEYEDSGKPVGFPSELADIVIRVFDLAGAMGIDIEAEISRKMLFNRSRAARHGGKLA